MLNYQRVYFIIYIYISIFFPRFFWNLWEIVGIWSQAKSCPVSQKRSLQHCSCQVRHDYETLHLTRSFIYFHWKITSKNHSQSDHFSKCTLRGKQPSVYLYDPVWFIRFKVSNHSLNQFHTQKCVSCVGKGHRYQKCCYSPLYFLYFGSKVGEWFPTSMNWHPIHHWKEACLSILRAVSNIWLYMVYPLVI